MKRALVWGIPGNVFFLGLVSFFTDISSEMTLTLLPLFLVNVLGVGVGIVGIIEGIGESTALLFRIISGYASDFLGKRKPLTVLGYGLSSFAKPFLYFATSWGMVLGIRFADRLGKGIRVAPRDALVADSTPLNIRGKAFGVHRALDTYGAMVGLVLAAIIVFLLQGWEIPLYRFTYQMLVLIAIPFGFLALFILIFFVKEPPKTFRLSSPLKIGLDLRFKLFLFIIALFSLARFSDAFFILRAQDLGYSPFHILLLLVMFNLIYATISAPAGVLSDRLGRKGVIIFGWLLCGLIYLGFAQPLFPLLIILLFALYGLYYGITEGVIRAFVADLVTEERRGSAYGLYHGVAGFMALPASIIAGYLWQKISPQTPFLFGSGLILLSTICLFILIKETKKV